jgi:tetratricopeptide (TPR) repeat protein
MMFKFFFLVLFTSVLLLAADTSLVSKLKSQHLTVAKESLEKHSELIGLIADTDSMDAAEKQYWLKELPNLADGQIKRLLDVLRTEKQKLDALDKQYAEESHALDIKQSREWIEKFDEILKSPDEPKPNQEFLLSGLEMIDFYLANAKADEPLMDKMLTITDTILSDQNLSIADRAHAHTTTFQVHGMYSNFTHLSQKQEHLNLAIESYKQMDTSDERLRQHIGKLLMALSYVNVCRGDFEGAIRAADETILFSTEAEPYVMTNKAHALMFLGKTEEAKALYARSLAAKERDDIIEGLGSDIEDFKVLKLPEQGIVVIESVVSDARKKGKK